MTIEELRVVISAKTEKLQEGINKATSKLRNFKKTSDDTSSAMGGSVKSMQKKLDSLSASFEKTQAKISNMQGELARLYEKQDAIVEKYRSMPAFSGMTKDESLEQMIKSDAGFQKLSSEIDKLQAKMQPFIEKNRQTKEEANKLSEALSRVGDNAKNAGDKIEKSGDSSQRAGKKMEEAGNRARASSSKVVGFANMIDNAFRRVLRRILVYNLIYRAIRGLISYMNASLMTNRQFVASLNQIKTNLMVAFQPIYDFILPALNALMRGIATVTTYIAAAISALFGKTYRQSFKAAKSLNTARQSMAGVGKA
nr:hypothetical protein [Clostridia bacterium]